MNNLPRMVVRCITEPPGGISTGDPILFFPDDPANPGFINSYALMGEHGEANRDFYYQCTIPWTGPCILAQAYQARHGRHRLVQRIARHGRRQVSLPIKG